MGMAFNLWSSPANARLLYTQRLEHCINRVGVEPGLELCEQLAGDRWDVLHACHRQQQAFGSGVEGDLQRLGEVLDRDDVACPSVPEPG